MRVPDPDAMERHAPDHTTPPACAQAVDEVLAATLEDRRLSRAERRALTDVLTDDGKDLPAIAVWRHRAFDLAREAMDAAKAPAERRAIMDWLEDVVRTLANAQQCPEKSARAEAHFSPGQAPLRTLRGLLGQARGSADVCVFTLTDDRLASAVLSAHKRGVALRLITDGHKSRDLGSDIERIADAGVDVRLDLSPAHMHHKYALFDRRVLVTGSYNWTRSAARDNQENVLVTDDLRFVARYREHFDELWRSLS